MTFHEGDRCVDLDRPSRYGTILAECREYGPVRWDDGSERMPRYERLRHPMEISYTVLMQHDNDARLRMNVWEESWNDFMQVDAKLAVCGECAAVVNDQKAHTNWHERQQPEPR